VSGSFSAWSPPEPGVLVSEHGLSSDYSVIAATDCPEWMSSWQVSQTTRDLRRRFAMTLAHAGFSGPSLSRVSKFPNMVNPDALRLPADLTPARDEPENQLLRTGDLPSPWNSIPEDRLLLPLQRYTTEPCDQWFPTLPAFDDRFKARA